MTARVPSSAIPVPRTSRLTIARLRSLILIALVAGISVFTGVMLTLVDRLSDRFGPEVRADLEWRAVRGAAELAKTVDLGVAVADAQMVKEAFGAYTTSSDVLAVVAVDAKGVTIAQHGAITDADHVFGGKPHATHEGDGYLASWAPVKIEGAEIGKVAIAVSTERLTETEAMLGSVSRTALLAGALALACGALVILFFTRAVSTRDAQLHDYAANLERKVEARTRELDERNRGMRLVLDNVAQGFLTLDLDGAIAAERSAIVDRWFDTPAPGTVFGDLVRDEAPDFATWLALGLESLRDNFLPPSVCLEQFPRRFARRGQTFDVAYSVIGGDDACAQILVILSDATEHLAREAAEREQREMFAVFQRILADRAGCEEFLNEASDLVAALDKTRDPLVEDRVIHTLKGNCGLFGFERYAALCHEIESELRESGVRTELSAEQRARLTGGWRAVVLTMGRLLGDGSRHIVEVELGELRAVAERAREGAPGREIAAALAAWTHEPVRRRFERLGQHAAAVARRLDKGSIEIEIHDGGLRLDGEHWAPFWNTAIHAVRNAVDHGFGPAGAGGRPPVLELTAQRTSTHIVLAIADNGRGIDWDAVRARAHQCGLPAATRDDLVAALFSDGVSTRERATELSGRGVGLAAVRAAVQLLGGTIDVASELGAGTRFTFRFPLESNPLLLRPPTQPVQIREAQG